MVLAAVARLGFIADLISKPTIDGPLFFANAATFRNEVRRMARADPAPRWILIAAEPITDVDTTASDVLEELDEALNKHGISLVFAELKDPVRARSNATASSAPSIHATSPRPSNPR